VEPARADEVVAAIRAVAASLSSAGVTPDELKRAREPLLTEIRTSERSNAYWLGAVLAAAQEHPERLDWARTRRADFEGATKAELDVLARRYLDPKEASVFVSLPAATQVPAAPAAGAPVTPAVPATPGVPAAPAPPATPATPATPAPPATPAASPGR
jgi:zinc protease